ncbi:MAG: NCS2 family permease [candidate division WOR-3 bacterium]|nr:NCS2 family permease [candidate division WOR-3 bacterium]
MEFFHLKDKGTSLRTEVIAGITTFMTMAYIIFVQPMLLSQIGMDFGAVMMATIISSIIATLIMGLYANYPIALAPAMGENFLFAYTIVLGMGVAWNKALGIVFISGLIFVILTLFRVREAVVNAIPDSLKKSIAAGIGIFITFIGLQWAGVIARSPASGVSLGSLNTNYVLLFFIGLFIMFFLIARKIKGAILWGILITAVIGIPMGIIKFQGVVSSPPSIAPTFFKLDILGALRWEYITPIVVLFLLDFFDTVGTLIGVSSLAGFLKKGKLPKVGKALMADAVGTVIGSLLGTSTVSSYIESTTGVSEGGKTGLANIFTALCFLLAIFFYPLVKAIGGGCSVGEEVYYPVTAPALVVVGSLMIKTVSNIKWDDVTESIPAFLTLIGIPLTYSISDGMALGFISYPIIKLFAGRVREVHPVMWVLFSVFAFRFIVLPT